MLDEMDRLRQTKELYGLLEYYQERAGTDRQAWQDRVLEMEGVAPVLKQLTPKLLLVVGGEDVLKNPPE